MTSLGALRNVLEALDTRGAAMAVATPLVYVDCCPPRSSFQVAEQADTNPCYDTATNWLTALPGSLTDSCCGRELHGHLSDRL